MWCQKGGKYGRVSKWEKSDIFYIKPIYVNHLLCETMHTYTHIKQVFIDKITPCKSPAITL